MQLPLQWENYHENSSCFMPETSRNRLNFIFYETTENHKIDN